jgi:hypothetical protein
VKEGRGGVISIVALDLRRVVAPVEIEGLGQVVVLDRVLLDPLGALDRGVGPEPDPDQDDRGEGDQRRGAVSLPQRLQPGGGPSHGAAD